MSEPIATELAQCITAFVGAGAISAAVTAIPRRRKTKKVQRSRPLKIKTPGAKNVKRLNH